MIQHDDLIRAEEGYLLKYIPDNEIWGKAAKLSFYKGHILTEDEFEEVKESSCENIDGVWYDFSDTDYTYADIKSFVIKLRYSVDDQLAIMLNDDEDKLTEMQNWREFAARVAKKHTAK